ncbi:hypothetical protein [Nocardiopsis suaedae]|uniref:Uncharacterized protein n=1 Tax=Nocardiopsis suaedae TaxID=3018444 RepID=A0ABT4TIH0_9ACTN|nr:hypothetical protein [Nocardiopsis suaedae]MDA2804450.1 hypothetical protein [Nocardiopsis suaedae]
MPALRARITDLVQAVLDALVSSTPVVVRHHTTRLVRDADGAVIGTEPDMEIIRGDVIAVSDDSTAGAWALIRARDWSPATDDTRPEAAAREQMTHRIPLDNPAFEIEWGTL